MHASHPETVTILFQTVWKPRGMRKVEGCGEKEERWERVLNREKGSRQADGSRPRQMQEKRDGLVLQRHCPEHSSGALLFLWRPRSHQSQHAAAHSVPIRNPRRTCSATDRLPPRFVLHRGAQASCCATGGHIWSPNHPTPGLALATAQPPLTH